MQRELLERATWESKTQLASAMFEWTEGIYNPAIGTPASADSPPADLETLRTAADVTA